MKWLVYLLLLANVSLLAYEFKRLEPPANSPPVEAASSQQRVNRLLLLREVDARRRGQAAGSAPAADVDPPPASSGPERDAGTPPGAGAQGEDESPQSAPARPADAALEPEQDGQENAEQTDVPAVELPPAAAPAAGDSTSTGGAEAAAAPPPESPIPVLGIDAPALADIPPAINAGIQDGLVDSPLSGGTWAPVQSSSTPGRQTIASSSWPPRPGEPGAESLAAGARAQANATTEAGEPVDPLATKAARPVCYRLAPFRDEAQARRAMGWLAERGASATLFVETVKRRSAVWIYLPPSESREAAVRKAREMSERGVRDLYVVNQGDNQNAISLGVYSHIPSLERRVRSLKAIGYDPQTVERYREYEVISLDAVLAGQSFPSRDDMIARFPAVDAESKACGGAM